jgi:hypothetical protein
MKKSGEFYKHLENLIGVKSLIGFGFLWNNLEWSSSHEPLVVKSGIKCW